MTRNSCLMGPPQAGGAGLSGLTPGQGRLRLPPGVSWADVAFFWDARHGMYRDPLNGIDLTPASAPARTARGGDVGVLFDGTDDSLTGALAIGDLAESHVLYLVVEQSTTGFRVPFSVEQAATPTTEQFLAGLRDAAGLGPYATKEEAGVAVTDFAGTPTVLGKIHQTTHRFGLTDAEAWLDGVSNGAGANTKIPRGLDQVVIGRLTTSVLMAGCVYFALLVRADARDAAVEAWIQSQWPVGTSP